MSTLTVVRPKPANGNGAGSARNWFTALNLHWAGVGLLLVVNLYLLARMGLLWHDASSRNADAQAQQRIELKTAELQAAPLQGVDEKLARSTEEADKFYRQRLPTSDAAMLTELGELTKREGVRLTGATYPTAEVLAGSPNELTELRIDARLSGDYRPLVRLINALERDKMFFVIRTVSLTGQQSGMVNLRLGVTTYLRPGGVSEAMRAQIGEGEAAGDAAGGAR